MIEKNSVTILADVFFYSPTKEFHARELSRKTGLSIFAILSAIKTLVKKDMIRVQKKGNMKIVAASHSVSFIRAKRIRNIEKLYDSGVVNYLIKAYDKPEAIVLFGSYSRGDDVESSDIDIGVITKEHKELNLDKFEKPLFRKISVHEIELKKVTKEFYNNLVNGIVLDGAIA
jgi:predicted nucleotidyltransferase